MSPEGSRDGKVQTYEFKKPETIVEKLCFFGQKEYFVAGTDEQSSCGSGLINLPLPVSPGR